MNHTLEGIKTRITEAKEKINDLVDRVVEITATKPNKEKKKWGKKRRQPRRPLGQH